MHSHWDKYTSMTQAWWTGLKPVTLITLNSIPENNNWLTNEQLFSSTYLCLLQREEWKSVQKYNKATLAARDWTRTARSWVQCANHRFILNLNFLTNSSIWLKKYRPFLLLLSSFSPFLPPFSAEDHEEKSEKLIYFTPPNKADFLFKFSSLPSV